MNSYRRLRNLLWRASMKGLSRRHHITRYHIYNGSQSIAFKPPRRNGRVLSVSHSERLAHLIGLKPSKLVQANYPKFNFVSLLFGNGSFDYVLSDQVLEHIESNP